MVRKKTSKIKTPRESNPGNNSQKEIKLSKSYTINPESHSLLGNAIKLDNAETSVSKMELKELKECLEAERKENKDKDKRIVALQFILQQNGIFIRNLLKKLITPNEYNTIISGFEKEEDNYVKHTMKCLNIEKLYQRNKSQLEYAMLLDEDTEDSVVDEDLRKFMQVSDLHNSQVKRNLKIEIENENRDKQKEETIEISQKNDSEQDTVKENQPKDEIKTKIEKKKLTEFFSHYQSEQERKKAIEGLQKVKKISTSMNLPSHSVQKIVESVLNSGNNFSKTKNRMIPIIGRKDTKSTEQKTLRNSSSPNLFKLSPPSSPKQDSPINNSPVLQRTVSDNKTLIPPSNPKSTDSPPKKDSPTFRKLQETFETEPQKRNSGWRGSLILNNTNVAPQKKEPLKIGISKNAQNKDIQTSDTQKIGNNEDPQIKITENSESPPKIGFEAKKNSSQITNNTHTPSVKENKKKEFDVLRQAPTQSRFTMNTSLEELLNRPIKDFERKNIISNDIPSSTLNDLLEELDTDVFRSSKEISRRDPFLSNKSINGTNHNSVNNKNNKQKEELILVKNFCAKNFSKKQKNAKQIVNKIMRQSIGKSSFSILNNTSCCCEYPLRNFPNIGLFALFDGRKGSSDCSLVASQILPDILVNILSKESIEKDNLKSIFQSVNSQLDSFLQSNFETEGAIATLAIVHHLKGEK